MKNKRLRNITWGVIGLLFYISSLLAVAWIMKQSGPSTAPTPYETARFSSPDPITLPTPTPLPSPQASPEPVAQQSDVTYIVKEEDGVVYVFVEGGPVPQKTLSIPLNNLRQYDRQRFADGIVVQSLEELAQLEEDFSD